MWCKSLKSWIIKCPMQEKGKAASHIKFFLWSFQFYILTSQWNVGIEISPTCPIFLEYKSLWLEMNQLSHLQIGKLTLVKNNLWCISKRFFWSIASHFFNHPPPNPMSETVNWTTTNSRTVWQKCRNSPIQLFCVSQFKSPQIKIDGLFMHFWWAGSILWQKRTNQNQFFSLT